MNEFFDDLRSYWRDFPRGIGSVFGLLFTVVAISWGVSEFVSGFISAGGVPKDSGWLKVLIASGVAGALYCLFDVAYYFSRRGAALRVDDDVTLALRAQVENSDCSEIRIFASGGDDAKARFIQLTRGGQKTQRQVAVKVLLRSDGTSKRMQSLQDLAEKWRKDVDLATAKNQNGYRFTTSFATYECPVMLRGYIFGSQVAALSWYARDDGLRSPPTMPTIVVKGVSNNGAALVEQAIEVFEFYFSKGRVL